jgi:hypothetical protein
MVLVFDIKKTPPVGKGKEDLKFMCSISNVLEGVRAKHGAIR